LSELLASKAVFLLPHPDDEIAVFALLALAAGRVETTCIYLTDGGWGGQSVERRERESSRVLAGFAVANVRFLGRELSVADGDLYRRLDSVFDVLDALLSRESGSIDVFVPAWEGGHQDHDAAHLIGARLALDPRFRVRQFSIYQGAGLPGPVFRMLAPLQENGAAMPVPAPLLARIRFLRRAASYPSQWKSMLGLLPVYALRMLTRHPFQLQAVTPGRCGSRPHVGPLLYERRGALTWPEFDAATADWRRAMTVAATQ
jgi:hypothetical protein